MAHNHNNENTDETEDGEEAQTRDVLSAVQFRRGDEIIESINESEVEVPREGEIVRIGEYQPVENQDALTFDGEAHIVREVIHQYASLPAGTSASGELLLATTTVVLDRLSD